MGHMAFQLVRDVTKSETLQKNLQSDVLHCDVGMWEGPGWEASPTRIPRSPYLAPTDLVTEPTACLFMPKG